MESVESVWQPVRWVRRFLSVECVCVFEIKDEKKRKRNTEKEKGMEIEKRDRQNCRERQRMRPSIDSWVFKTAEVCISAPLILL